MQSFPRSRREFLQRAAGGFGALALAGMLAEQAQANPADPLAPKKSHFPAKAQRVIFIFSTGGVSHVDTFDHKPKLIADHGKTITIDNWQGKKGTFERTLKKPNWAFARHGKSGTWVSGLFPKLAGVIDDVCVFNSLYGDHTGHDKATMGMHTGSFNFARPSIGSWVSYGLGTVNRNLPSFVVLAPHAPYTGAQAWGSDFLPGCHQGTHIVPGPNPLPNLKPRVPYPDLQAMELDLLRSVNSAHRESRAAEAALDAQIRAFETAYGMQQEAPEAFALTGETDATLGLYGIDRKTTAGFGWQCLVARRLAERGVRFIELIDVGSSANWDSHGNMADHERLAKAIDQPIAGLITDLKQRGLLDSTLIVWTTEFGRTPYNLNASAMGREHHHQVFSSWMAGGGVKGGVTYGTSDEYGINPDVDPVHVHDFHATILHLLGMDHEKLTYRYAGRDFRLTDVAGEVVTDVIA
ncbi:DUF1501 domain-containing protein [Tuwongella immobilis]|uniref:DUF1501 domain-containing protein n=1 Tax=Tuwongella immobilis TaxID=692036 RepID=A0A6C2YPC8_9BACT|nr:DUF1501 domain-containing protein [Tuwongella immobilis]VIP03480.1 secreted protein containing duf1501 : Uncharacterized protein OS=Pirellula staleyi (strain ATCC 27377 / DSM 6068 / ICPB 4128) GN=Psta_3446 PE=4 SV=1: DUF1501 [Tuwongella immobilis]VTS04330.1 secreted protein containing duf1501 : Uncharacterized protein OS=Pirellula staleyi (strain ATCC 27377 / DSM 6068 / ICPB 4128) GN=Psta_3446 PE=4 SV=1: DUF1501 [Tuwongella immobilis]